MRLSARRVQLLLGVIVGSVLVLTVVRLALATEPNDKCCSPAHAEDPALLPGAKCKRVGSGCVNDVNCQGSAWQVARVGECKDESGKYCTMKDTDGSDLETYVRIYLGVYGCTTTMPPAPCGGCTWRMTQPQQSQDVLKKTCSGDSCSSP